MDSVPAGILKRLTQADEFLRDHVAVPESLAPNRREATPLASLGERIFGDLRPECAEVLADGLHSILVTQVRHFPETLFWDLDYVAASMVEQAMDSTPAETRKMARNIVQLQEQYGCQSVICFRYVHDFTYGYDWAKWVRRRPGQRSTVGPFDRTFIDYLMSRGDELEALIARDDQKYPKLPDGTPRNPFGFSREPADERRLFIELASRDLLPVRTWEARGTPTWDRDFAGLRQSVAAELGIPTK